MDIPDNTEEGLAADWRRHPLTGTLLKVLEDEEAKSHRKLLSKCSQSADASVASAYATWREKAAMAVVFGGKATGKGPMR